MNKIVKLAIVLMLSCTSATAQDNWQTVAGGVVGGAAGAKLCKGQGNGQAACAVAGALAGAYVGNSVAEAREAQPQTQRRVIIHGDTRAQPQNYQNPDYLTRNRLGQQRGYQEPVAYQQTPRYQYQTARQGAVPAQYVEQRPAQQCTEYQQPGVTMEGRRIVVIQCACQDNEGQFRQADAAMCQ